MKLLCELAAEYEAAVENQNVIIANCRRELAQAVRLGSQRERYELESRLAALYRVRNELCLTSARLRHYYDNSSEDRQSMREWKPDFLSA